MISPEKALNIIAGQCSKKEYCSKDVREKLARWELAEKDVAAIMEFLYRHKFIDDSRFARTYAEDKFRFNHWGKQKIIMMLRQKGIPSDMIEESLEVIGRENYDAACLEILQQKLRSIPEEDPYKQRAKLTRFALGRGFDYETINKCLEVLIG